MKLDVEKDGEEHEAHCDFKKRKKLSLKYGSSL